MSIGMLRRLDAINRMSRDIMTGDLSHRVPVRGTGDDFDTLAGNLNAMLARIQDLMVTVKGVSENIAHDLRTPLARLRSRLEAARIQPPTADLYETWVDGTIAEVDKVLETFEALLKIAEIESGKPRESFAKVDLTSVVADVVEFYEPLAEERDQRFDIAIEAVHEIIGDRNLLFRALANLIDNAIKYAPLGGYVGVTLRNDPSGPTVLVADNGPGIPPQAHEKVFRRLFRLETSRSKPGNGLGLSLVAAVVDLHGIVMTLDDNSPGLRVSLRFKQA
jgi:signal transduction histidine kinase